MADWIFETRPIVCEEHDNRDGTVSRITVGSGMINPEGKLICPMCYKPAHYASDEEAAAFSEMVAKHKTK